MSLAASSPPQGAEATAGRPNQKAFIFRVVPAALLVVAAGGLSIGAVECYIAWDSLHLLQAQRASAAPADAECRRIVQENKTECDRAESQRDAARQKARATDAERVQYDERAAEVTSRIAALKVQLEDKEKDLRNTAKLRQVAEQARASLDALKDKSADSAAPSPLREARQKAEDELARLNAELKRLKDQAGQISDLQKQSKAADDELVKAKQNEATLRVQLKQLTDEKTVLEQTIAKLRAAIAQRSATAPK